MGVWIETEEAGISNSPNLSHPSWVCGLKRDIADGKYTLKQVTPFVGVWIETRWRRNLGSMSMSHPSWVCGLKPFNSKPYFIDMSSHPSWVCGLKHTDVSLLQRIDKSHPSWVCGLKLILLLILMFLHVSHPSWVCGLKQKSQENVNKSIEVTPFVGVWIETRRNNE